MDTAQAKARLAVESARRASVLADRELLPPTPSRAENDAFAARWTTPAVEAVARPRADMAPLRARLQAERERIARAAEPRVRPPQSVTWRPTPIPIENNRKAANPSAITMQKIWDLSPIDPGAFDPTQPGVIPDPPANTTTPFVTPLTDLSVGAQLVLSVGAWSGSPTYTRQWTHNSTPIVGETGVGYIISADFIGEMIGATVIASNAGGSASADAAPVGPISPDTGPLGSD